MIGRGQICSHHVGFHIAFSQGFSFSTQSTPLSCRNQIKVQIWVEIWAQPEDGPQCCGVELGSLGNLSNFGNLSLAWCLERKIPVGRRPIGLGGPLRRRSFSGDEEQTPPHYLSHFSGSGRPPTSGVEHDRSLNSGNSILHHSGRGRNRAHSCRTFQVGPFEELHIIRCLSNLCHMHH